MNAVSNRRGLILRRRFLAEIGGTAVVWAVLAVGTALVVGAVAIFRSGDITVSGWEQAMQIARWYAGAVGVYATAVYLPLYISHGFTRREFAGQLPVYLGGFALAFAVLMTLGYGVEAFAYDLLGWEQALTREHMYSTATHYSAAFFEFLLVGVVWSVTGTVLGGAFYRHGALGMLLIPVALTMVGSFEMLAGPGYVGPFGFVTEIPLFANFSANAASLVTTATAAIAAVVVGLGLMWLVVRDLPIRTKSA